MKKKWLIIAAAVMVAVLLSACGTDVRKLEGKWGLKGDTHKVFAIYPTDEKTGTLVYFAHSFDYTVKGNKFEVSTTGWGGMYTFEIPFKKSGKNLKLTFSEEAGFYSLKGEYTFVKLD